MNELRKDGQCERTGLRNVQAIDAEQVLAPNLVALLPRRAPTPPREKPTHGALNDRGGNVEERECAPDQKSAKDALNSEDGRVAAVAAANRGKFFAVQPQLARRCRVR